MSEPVWLTAPRVAILHAEFLRLCGGSPGLRDRGVLESAVAHPRQLFAGYANALVRYHPFVDGNNGVGLLAARAFLFANGHRLEPGEAEAVLMMRKLAAGEISETALAAWVEAGSRR